MHKELSEVLENKGKRGKQNKKEEILLRNIIPFSTIMEFEGKSWKTSYYEVNFHGLFNRFS